MTAPAAVIALRRTIGGLVRRALGRQLGMGETQRFLLLSIMVGVFVGLLVVCFHFTIELLSWTTVHAPGHERSWWALLWPPLGAGVAYAMVLLWFRPALGSGVNNTKAALYVSDGYVPTRSIAGKFAACAASIGTGNPMGPEDPALQMGAGVASLLGRLFRLSRANMRLVAPTGAAAGIAAAFNTPITGVLFVMEEVVGAWNAAVLGSIVLSAVASVVVTRWFLGDAPLLQVPLFRLVHPGELLIYAVMGVVGGALSAWFTRAVRRVRGRVLALKPLARHALPVVAGLLVGVAALWMPEVLGTGYRTIDGALHERFAWQALLVLAALKLLTTSTSFCAGTPGGMFAPTLVIGALLGGGIAGLAHQFWPMPLSPVSAYVLVGIGTFFVGVFRAPMTSVFMVFEVSGTYAIVLPVMVANTFSYLISRSLQRESLFHLVAKQDGLNLPSVEDQRDAPGLHVEDAMACGLSRVLDGHASVEEGLKQMEAEGLGRGLVTAGWGDWRIAERSDLERALQMGVRRRISEIDLPRSKARLYPDAGLHSALSALATTPIAPVLSRANPRLLLGTLTLDDVLRAYGVPRLEAIAPPMSEGEAPRVQTALRDPRAGPRPGGSRAERALRRGSVAGESAGEEREVT